METITIAEHETVRTIAVILCPILLGILGWLIRGMIKKGEDDLKALAKSFNEMTLANALVQKDIQTINISVMRINAMSETMHRIQEDVSVLKRDQKTIWKRFDEIREDLRK